MGDGMLHGAGECVHWNGLRVLSGVNGGLSGFHNSVAFERGDFYDLASQLTCQLFDVYLVTLFAYYIHHVDGHNNRDSQFRELSGEVKVTFKVRAVYYIKDGIGALTNEVVTGNDLFKRVRGKGIDTGKVTDGNIIVLLQFAFLFLHRNARPVTHKLVGAGESIEQRSLTAVRVTRQGNSDLLLFHINAPLEFLYSTSIISVSALRRLSSYPRTVTSMGSPSGATLRT